MLRPTPVSVSLGRIPFCEHKRATLQVFASRVICIRLFGQVCKDEDPTPFKRQYLVLFVYVCLT